MGASVHVRGRFSGVPDHRVRFCCCVLPVWLLLAPRDYLSAFIKTGAIFSLAAGILIVRPQIMMPPLTRFIDGSGPVFAGKIFPFCFITIACGAISGFHSLISSGTTPKMILREGHARIDRLWRDAAGVVCRRDGYGGGVRDAAGRLFCDQQSREHSGRNGGCCGRHDQRLGIPSRCADHD